MAAYFFAIVWPKWNGWWQKIKDKATKHFSSSFFCCLVSERLKMVRCSLFFVVFFFSFGCLFFGSLFYVVVVVVVKITKPNGVNLACSRCPSAPANSLRKVFRVECTHQSLRNYNLAWHFVPFQFRWLTGAFRGLKGSWLLLFVVFSRSFSFV